MKHVCDAGAEKCVVKVLKDKLKYANCVLLRGCVKMLYSLVQAKQVSFLYCGEVCNMTEVCAEKNCQESVWWNKKYRKIFEGRGYLYLLN